jgi:hypothetical protein
VDDQWQFDDNWEFVKVRVFPHFTGIDADNSRVSFYGLSWVQKGFILIQRVPSLTALRLISSPKSQGFTLRIRVVLQEVLLEMIPPLIGTSITCLQVRRSESPSVLLPGLP